MLQAHITGWGSAVPEDIISNSDLVKMVDTSEEWIVSRTGIYERRIASAEESSASLGTEAALQALEVANLNPVDVDLIIVATSSPEYIFPATASLIQDRIGATNAGAFDLSAACTGFIIALNMASQAIRTGSIKNAVVIGTETLSRITNWNDRSTCILFGDGAGAFVLQASEKPGGVLSAVMRSDGSGSDLLILPGGGSKLPTSPETVARGDHYIRMKGREVFRFASRVMVQATRDVAAMAGIDLDDVCLIIPHQANRRIIESAAKGLRIPLDRFVINLEYLGNTSTASIPLAAVDAINAGRLNIGDRVVLVGFGSGLTWGAVAIQWSGPLTPEETYQAVWPYRFHGLYRLYIDLRSRILRWIRRIEGWIWGGK